MIFIFNTIANYRFPLPPPSLSLSLSLRPSSLSSSSISVLYLLYLYFILLIINCIHFKLYRRLFPPSSSSILIFCFVVVSSTCTIYSRYSQDYFTRVSTSLKNAIGDNEVGNSLFQVNGNVFDATLSKTNNVAAYPYRNKLTDETLCFFLTWQFTSDFFYSYNFSSL